MKSKYFKIILSFAIIFSFCLLIIASHEESECFYDPPAMSGIYCNTLEEEILLGGKVCTEVVEMCCSDFYPPYGVAEYCWERDRWIDCPDDVEQDGDGGGGGGGCLYNCNPYG